MLMFLRPICVLQMMQVLCAGHTGRTERWLPVRVVAVCVAGVCCWRIIVHIAFDRLSVVICISGRNRLTICKIIYKLLNSI